MQKIQTHSNWGLKKEKMCLYKMANTICFKQEKGLKNY